MSSLIETESSLLTPLTYEEVRSKVEMHLKSNYYIKKHIEDLMKDIEDGDDADFLIDKFLDKQLSKNRGWELFDFEEDEFSANLILRMLQYANKYRLGFADPITVGAMPIKDFTVEKIFNQFATVVAEEYKDTLMKMIDEKCFQIRERNGEFLNLNDQYIFNTFEEAMSALDSFKEHYDSLVITESFKFENEDKFSDRATWENRPVVVYKDVFEWNK